jgi:hypothetical protein
MSQFPDGISVGSPYFDPYVDVRAREASAPAVQKVQDSSWVNTAQGKKKVPEKPAIGFTPLPVFRTPNAFSWISP